MKKFLGISLLGLVLLSCSKDQILEELGVVPYTITFEDVALESSGFMEYKYAEHGVGFEGGTYEFAPNDIEYYGFAISCLDVSAVSGTYNPYIVSAVSGAEGSSNFAVFHDPFDLFNPYLGVQLAPGVEHQVVSAFFCLTHVTLQAIEDGIDIHGNASAFGVGDHFDVTAIGFDRYGYETARVTISLADFRRSPPALCLDWRLVDLRSLGLVNRIEFIVSSTDCNSYTGESYTPAYFAIDNLKFERKRGV